MGSCLSQHSAMLPCRGYAPNQKTPDPEWQRLPELVLSTSTLMKSARCTASLFPSAAFPLLHSGSSLEERSSPSYFIPASTVRERLGRLEGFNATALWKNGAKPSRSDDHSHATRIQTSQAPRPRAHTQHNPGERYTTLDFRSREGYRLALPLR